MGHSAGHDGCGIPRPQKISVVVCVACVVEIAAMLPGIDEKISLFVPTTRLNMSKLPYGSVSHDSFS